MNSIRIPFNYRLFTSEYYMGSGDPARGFIYLDRVISWCKKEKLYVILDMHCAPGGQTGDNIDDGYGYPFLFENEKDQAECASIWNRIASRYKNEPIIIRNHARAQRIWYWWKLDKMGCFKTTYTN